jgi:pyruvate/2-oxoglutarate dehydrogenase complex dihydrolipoamide dehydrogenase (E3) component
MMVKNQGAHIPDMLFDQFNIEMYDNVRPVKWNDPEEGKYDLLCIGAGAGGLVSAAGAASIGAKACMIERGFIGGDCLVTGCVPSKAFIKAASVANYVKNCEQFGVRIEGEIKIDFATLMDRMKKIRAQISHHDAATNWTNKYGIDIFLGQAKFIDRNTVEVNGKKLTFTKACIASGG